MKKAASGCRGGYIPFRRDGQIDRVGLCGGRAHEEISDELYELPPAPTPGIIFCNLLKHAGGKAHWQGVSMSWAPPEAQGIKPTAAG